jgi:hypothetical protein
MKYLRMKSDFEGLAQPQQMNKSLMMVFQIDSCGPSYLYTELGS